MELPVARCPPRVHAGHILLVQLDNTTGHCLVWGAMYSRLEIRSCRWAMCVRAITFWAEPADCVCRCQRVNTATCCVCAVLYCQTETPEMMERRNEQRSRQGLKKVRACPPPPKRRG